MGLGLFMNFYLFNHAQGESSADQSVIFSFVRNNPHVNNNLLAAVDTTTLLYKTDQLISKAFSPSSSIVLASTQADNSIFHNDPTPIQDDFVVKTNPADTQNFVRQGLTTYTVTSGDNCSSIASSFGISIDTIRTENKIGEECILKPGQELIILPTTGITHALTESDTLEGLLKKYKVTEDDFLDANNIESFEDLALGTEVVIPMDNPTSTAPTKVASKFVKDESNKVALTKFTAPADLEIGSVSFIWPTPVRTITQGFSSRHTGIDISNSKMEAIYASADGYVEISGYQANGYGNTIVINHGSGFKTRYGHASELYVKAGEYVKQGQLIAKQGRTGRVRGVTGIHLHFEIIKNGKQVSPLNYVRP